MVAVAQQANILRPWKLVSGDKHSIAYRPIFARLTGSVTSAVLLQQILYRWDMNGEIPFYKFKEIPDNRENPKYKPGDSWCEEIAFTRTEFDTALTKIGTKITKGHSKSVAIDHKMPDPADWVGDDEGYGYALDLAVKHLIIYWTDGNRLTWYHLNTDLLDQFLTDIYGPKVEILLYLEKYRNRLYLGKVEKLLYPITESTRDNHKENTLPNPPIGGSVDKVPADPFGSRLDDVSENRSLRKSQKSRAKDEGLAVDVGTLHSEQSVADETKPKEPITPLVASVPPITRAQALQTTILAVATEATQAVVSSIAGAPKTPTMPLSPMQKSRVAGPVEAEGQLPVEIKTEAPTPLFEVPEAPAGFVWVCSSALDQPECHLTTGSVKGTALCKRPFGQRDFYRPNQINRRAPCQACLAEAAKRNAPKPARTPRVRPPQVWDSWIAAIATAAFGAKDQAGINAKMGRIGPILHGDKQNGRCDGLIAYECARQGKERSQLDFEALAKDTPVFWSWYRRTYPDRAAQLADCAKWCDYWSTWRGIVDARPAPTNKPDPNCPDCSGSGMIVTEDEKHQKFSQPCKCRGVK